jgi:hypothetical protein
MPQEGEGFLDKPAGEDPVEGPLQRLEGHRQPSLSRIPVYLLRDLLQRARVRVYSDVKLVWVRAGAMVYKKTVSSPNVDHYPLAGRGQ